MINDWRDKWHQGTGGQTDPMFPFGFVQVQNIAYSMKLLIATLFHSWLLLATKTKQLEVFQ